MRKVRNVIVVLLLLSLSVSTAYLAYLHFFASNDKNLSGEWTAELDLSKEAAVTALGWLQDIEAVDISLEDMENYMQGLTVQVNLTMEQTADSGGIFQSSVLPESYAACKQAAYEAFVAAFQELLVQRLRMAGYTGGTDKESIEALVTETFGMSTFSYLLSCGPALLPSLEELQAGYDGSGSYEAAEGILIRRYDTGWLMDVKTERYVREGDILIMTEDADLAETDLFYGQYPVVYILRQDEQVE